MCANHALVFLGMARAHYLIVEEMDSVVVQLQGQGLQKRDIVCHDLLIGEIKLMDNDGIDMVVGEQVIWEGKRRKISG